MNENILEVIVNAISEKKGERIMVYDFSNISPFVEHVVITSASNLRQVHAIANHIASELKEKKAIYTHSEGDNTSRWILVDAKDVVVHVFLSEERDLYQLEKLYCDIPMMHYDL